MFHSVDNFMRRRQVLPDIFKISLSSSNCVLRPGIKRINARKNYSCGGIDVDQGRAYKDGRDLGVREMEPTRHWRSFQNLLKINENVLCSWKFPLWLILVKILLFLKNIKFSLTFREILVKNLEHLEVCVCRWLRDGSPKLESLLKTKSKYKWKHAIFWKFSQIIRESFIFRS